MNPASMHVFDVALTLPDDQRAELAYRLLQSLKPPGALCGDSPTCETELERRVRAYETGETTADDWANASLRLKQALEEGPPS